MKIKYLRLSKNERKKVKNEFYSTNKGSIIRKNLNNARICAILCLIYATYILIEHFIKDNSVSNIVLSITVFIFGIGMLIYAHKIYLKSVNEYVVKNKK